MAKSDFSCVETPFLSGSRHCTSVLQTQFPKLCTDLHLCLLYILILGTYSNFARKNHFLARRLLSAALLECWLQVCRVKITFTILPTNRFVCTTKKLMKCVVNWILLRIRVRSRNTQPHLNKDIGCCPHACYACYCAHPCCCFCFCVAFCCFWWICCGCCGAPLDIWGAQQLRTGCLSILMLKNSREKWRKWISLTGSHCWPSASANHRQTG